jgi:hypothetical protein
MMQACAPENAPQNVHRSSDVRRARVPKQRWVLLRAIKNARNDRTFSAAPAAAFQQRTAAHAQDGTQHRPQVDAVI